MQQKIMILGAGICQVPLITKAKRMGLRTLVVSRSGDYPGFQLADVPIQLDVTDVDGILAKAREYRIDGVVTNQTDMGVQTVAYVAEQLGLPGIGVACARLFTDKFLMKEIAATKGIARIRFHRVSSISQAVKLAAEMRLPVVVKPSDSQGSRGVSRVDSIEDLIAAFAAAQSFSRSGAVMIEEYFNGAEVIVDGIMINGVYQSFPPGDVELFDIPNKFIPRSILYPSKLPAALLEKVIESNSNLVAAMDLPFGLTHAEYRVCPETGEVLLLEIAARGGGMFISSDIIPLATGVDTEGILLKQALGVRVGCRTQEWYKAAGFVCLGLPPGRVKAIEGLIEACSIPGLKWFLCDLRVGDEVTEMTDKTSRAGVFILVGETRDDLEQTRELLDASIKIVVESHQELDTPLRL